jgi:Transposase DDE domain
LAAQAVPLATGREAEALKGLTAVDGSIFAALPRMAWALWMDAEHRGVKLHLHFDVLKGVPADATLTPAACSEGEALAGSLQPGCLYVVDRGYVDYELFAKVIGAKSSLIVRVKDNTAFVVQEERPLTAAAVAAGVVRDVVISRLGSSYHKDHLKRAMRLVIVRIEDRDGKTTELWLITDRLDLDADLVALAYRYRWSVEVCQADYVSSDTLYRCPEPPHSGRLGVVGAGPMVSSTPRFQPGTTAMRRHIERHLPPRLGIIRDARSA